MRVTSALVVSAIFTNEKLHKKFKPHFFTKMFKLVDAVNILQDHPWGFENLWCLMGGGGWEFAYLPLPLPLPGVSGLITFLINKTLKG